MNLPVKPRAQADISKGIELCFANSKRLADHANLLFEAQHADMHVVYALWSLAVEELGKAMILSDCKASGKEIPAGLFQGSHKEKFERGLSTLQNEGTLLPKLEEVLRIVHNTSAKGKTIDRRGNSIAIPAGATGWFRDLIPDKALDPSHMLRLASLYVDLRDGQWVSPLGYLDGEVAGHWDLTHDSMKPLIAGLLDHFAEKEKAVK